jgi:pyruvate carboxylase
MFGHRQVGAGRRESRSRQPRQVAGLIAGVVTVSVAEGDVVRAGQSVVTIEAMKTEAPVTPSVSG